MTFPARNIKGAVDPEMRMALDVRDAAIIGRYVNGERATSIAKDYGLTRERVRQILQGSLGKRGKNAIQKRNSKVRHLQKLLSGKPAVSASHLRDVAGVVAAKPGSPTVAGVRAQRSAKPAE